MAVKRGSHASEAFTQLFIQLCDGNWGGCRGNCHSKFNFPLSCWTLNKWSITLWSLMLHPSLQVTIGLAACFDCELIHHLELVSLFWQLFTQHLPDNQDSQMKSSIDAKRNKKKTEPPPPPPPPSILKPGGLSVHWFQHGLTSSSLVVMALSCCMLWEWAGTELLNQPVGTKLQLLLWPLFHWNQWALLLSKWIYANSKFDPNVYLQSLPK